MHPASSWRGPLHSLSKDARQCSRAHSGARIRGRIYSPWLKADRAKAEGAVIGPCGMNSRAVGQSQPRYRKAVLRN